MLECTSHSARLFIRDIIYFIFILIVIRYNVIIHISYFLTIVMYHNGIHLLLPNASVTLVIHSRNISCRSNDYT